MPAKRDVIQAMQATAKFYGNEAARPRKDRREAIQAGQEVPELAQLGVPHPHVWVALIGAPVGQGGIIGQANLQKIT
eukprot:7352646-Pyramimonas_sp.AAC.1